MDGVWQARWLRRPVAVHGLLPVVCVAAVVVAVAVAVAGVALWSSGAPASSGVPGHGRVSTSGNDDGLLGGPAPPLAGPTLAGGHLELADFRGHVVVVNVWAGWCGPCADELPILVSAERRLHDRGLRLVGINTRDGERQARELVDEAGGDPGLMVVDPDGLHAAEWGAAGVPATFVVDESGQVTARSLGAVDDDWIATHVEPLLEGGAG